MGVNIEVISFLILMFFTTRRFRCNTYFKYLPYFIMFAFMALRYNYGDGAAYRIMFGQLRQGINLNDTEPMWVWLNNFLPTFRCVIVVTSAIYVIAFYIVLSKCLTYRQRALALMIVVIHPYILMVDMSAIRQSVAIAIIMIGVYVANKYRPIYFVSFCGIAALFHRSAIITIPLMILFNKKNFNRNTKRIIGVGTVMLLLLPQKFLSLVETALRLFKINTNNYMYYLNSGNKNSMYAVIISLVLLMFLLTCCDTVDNKHAIYVKLSILAMVLESLQGVIQQLGRVTMYFLPFMAISLPLILKNENRTLKINLWSTEIVLDKHCCMLAEAVLLAIFGWKFVRFMTIPHYTYHSILFRF